MHPDVLAAFEALFTPTELTTIGSKVELVADPEVGMSAEDATGNVYRYAVDPFPQTRPDTPAHRWLGVAPDLHPEEDA